MILLAYLVAGHALADYPLQGDFLAKAKNRHNPVPGVPWYQALGAHAVIHGAIAAVITGLPWVFIGEAIAHAMIDDAKCAGRISFNKDQALHFLCKLAWFAAAWSA